MPNTELYFAFIRAINTGGRRLTNDRIIEPFLRLGFTEVAGYQAAGNVAFRTPDPTAAEPGRIEPALAEGYGFDAPVFTRHIDQVRAIVNERPFTREELESTDRRIQVAFLRAVPDRSTISAVQDLVPAGDRVVFSGRDGFWLPTQGVSDSALPIRAIEELAGPMTIRTLGTVARMVTRFSP